MSTTSMPAVASAVAVLAAGALSAGVYSFGALSGHMALHIALMNVAAPLVAALLVHTSTVRSGGAAMLWLAAAVQIVLLWGWHTPALQQMAIGSHVLQLFMHTSLFISALCFWSALLVLPPRARWHAIPVLLLTGKLACLLAALLVFAPRLLYEARSHLATDATIASALADQQLAGLLMIVACPLSYIIAGVVFAAQIIGDPDVKGAVRGRAFPAVR